MDLENVFGQVNADCGNLHGVAPLKADLDTCIMAHCDAGWSRSHPPHQECGLQSQHLDRSVNGRNGPSLPRCSKLPRNMLQSIYSGYEPKVPDAAYRQNVCYFMMEQMKFRKNFDRSCAWLEKIGSMLDSS
ncbi:MAG: hypothetical protein AAGA08_01640 [Pseudomonadota bacterium]